MSDSQKPNSRSKEPTVPRDKAQTPKAISADKKPEKKIEPTVMVAIISAVVTILTAILSSPVLLAMINNDSSAPNAAEAELAASVSTPTASQAEQEALAKATDAPAEVVLVQPTPTENNESLSPETNLPEPTEAATNPPAPPPTEAPPTETSPPPAVENTPVPATGSVPAFFECLSTKLWTPYPPNLNPAVSNGCWDFSDWGYTTEQAQLIIANNPAQAQQRGFYMPLTGDVDIQFTIQLNTFRIRSNDLGFLHFGIVQLDPFSNFAGGFLSYQQPQPGAGAAVRVQVSGSNQATQNITSLAPGFTQEIRLSIRGALLTVYIDGKPVGDPVNLTPGARAFWIGYVLPSRGNLEAVISNFTILPH